MFVITDLLHAAGNESHRAAEHAQEGADQLSRRPLSSGILGEFPAADAVLIERLQKEKALWR